MYTRLLVPIDGSATSRLALTEAAALARLSGAKVVLLHIVDEMEHLNGFEPPVVYISEMRPRFLQAGRELLAQARAELEAEHVAAETVLVESRGARVSELIADQASQVRADLIVLGTHGRRGLDRLLIGSDAEQVARIAPVPVMLVRARRPAQPGGEARAG